MMAEIVLLRPLVGRRDYIVRHARIISRYSERGANGALRYQLKVQREKLLRWGLPVEVADREVRALEQAIRVEVCRLNWSGGAA